MKTIGNLTGIKIQHDDDVDDEGQATSYADMWEVSRLSYMGAIKTNKGAFKEDI
jgi:hypothetical protein